MDSSGKVVFKITSSESRRTTYNITFLMLSALALVAIGAARPPIEVERGRGRQQRAAFWVGTGCSGRGSVVGRKEPSNCQGRKGCFLDFSCDESLPPGGVVRAALRRRGFGYGHAADVNKHAGVGARRADAQQPSIDPVHP